MEKKTKAEIEKLGRQICIELDKRLTKSKLIQQLKNQVEDKDKKVKELSKEKMNLEDSLLADMHK